MPATLLASQLEALEPLDPDELHVLLDVRRSPAELADTACAALEALAVESTTAAGE